MQESWTDPSNSQLRMHKGDSLDGLYYVHYLYAYVRKCIRTIQHLGTVSTHVMYELCVKAMHICTGMRGQNTTAP